MIGTYTIGSYGIEIELESAISPFQSIFQMKENASATNTTFLTIKWNLDFQQTSTCEQWKKGPWLFVRYIGDEILPIYIRIVYNRWF